WPLSSSADKAPAPPSAGEHRGKAPGGCAPGRVPSAGNTPRLEGALQGDGAGKQGGGVAAHSGGGWRDGGGGSLGIGRTRSMEGGPPPWPHAMSRSVSDVYGTPDPPMSEATAERAAGRQGFPIRRMAPAVRQDKTPARWGSEDLPARAASALAMASQDRTADRGAGHDRSGYDRLRPPAQRKKFAPGRQSLGLEGVVGVASM
ncbi:hypothetical protein T484DRAFT_1797003, partial [Baffinella frigidus]